MYDNNYWRSALQGTMLMSCLLSLESWL